MPADEPAPDADAAPTADERGDAAPGDSARGDAAPTLLPALLIALGVGFLIGLVNGVGIAWVKIPPLVMTLGMMGVVKGLILVYTGGRPQGATPPVMKSIISDPWVLGIPGDVFI
ncbi:hypothetical protein H4F44_24665, partial [Escherichia coli]|uniref:ABC transporter permease subunit n=1 Tax=Escherichia coli TaxID=562 RepID=UPI003F79594E|nr:hypothetical protein [Escherichia coli]